MLLRESRRQFAADRRECRLYFRVCCQARKASRLGFPKVDGAALMPYSGVMLRSEREAVSHLVAQDRTNMIVLRIDRARLLHLPAVQ